MRKEITKATLGLMLLLLAGCGDDDCWCGFGTYDRKHDCGDFTIGDSLQEIYNNIPGGQGLIRMIPRLTFEDAIGEKTLYSSSQQDGKVPDPSQDLRFVGFTTRRLSALDLTTLRGRFPEGQGPNGTLFKASNLAWNPGQYLFVHTEYEGDVPINESDKALQYAVVWDRDGLENNNWVGQGIFDQDFFIGSDKWLQLWKQVGSTAQLTMSETDAGSTVNDVQSRAAAIVKGNALVYMLPMTEFPDRNLFASLRATAFWNIDGSYGLGNDEGWSGDTAPVQTEPLYIPSTSTLTRFAPRFELSYRLVASNEDLLAKYGLPYSSQWPIERDEPLSNTAVDVDLNREFLWRGGLSGWRSLLGPTTAAGAFTPAVFDAAEAPNDFSAYRRVPGDVGIPFTASDFGRMLAVGNIMFNLDVPPAEGTDPTEGELVGNVLGPDSFQVFLEQLQSDGTVQVLTEPKIFAVNGQASTIIAHNWQVNVADLTLPVRDQADAIDGPQTADIGATLSITPRLTVTDRIQLELRPYRGASIQVEDVTVDGEARQVRFPVIETMGLKTTVEVGSGETVVIGGLLQEGSMSIQPGMPFLQDIPAADGSLFNQRTYDRDTELIVFITPYLLDGAD